MAIIGGRQFDFSRAEIEQRMRDVQPEALREHVVEMLDTVFPPKQVIAVLTGWDRGTFTTQEAQRVLSALGFTCRRVGQNEDGRPSWLPVSDEQVQPSSEDLEALAKRIEGLDAALTVAQAALATLLRRVDSIEAKIPQR